MKQEYYGRKYQVLVVMEDGTTALDVSNSVFEPEALRVVFRIEYVGYEAYYWGEIDIYNLEGETEKKIITEGSKVIIQAGYRDGPYGKIFEGYVLQPMRDRENVVDYKLTLNCVDQKLVLDKNFTKFTANVGLDTRGQIEAVAKNSNTPITLGHITDDLPKTQLPRGKVFFGEPKKYFRQLAHFNSAQWWVKDNEVHISKITDIPEGEALVYTPSTGLVGTPVQTDSGVTFKVLLDPRLKIKAPAMMVKLDQALIRQQKIKYGQYVSVLDRDGQYQVAGVSHIGDTRGNDWYTEVIGISSGGRVPLQLTGQQVPEMLKDKGQDPN